MATAYLSPGVYVEEIDRGSKPIQGVGTAVAAFVGFTAKTPSDDPSDPAGLKPRLVTNWSQFEQLYGGFTPGAILPHAVYGYFNNGGGSAYIVPVGRNGGSDAAPPTQGLPAQSSQDKTPLEITSRKVDGRVEVTVEVPKKLASKANDDEGDEPKHEPPTFTLKVKADGKDAETWPDLTLGVGPRNVETIVNAQSQLITVETSTTPGVALAEQLPKAGRYSLEPASAGAAAVSSRDFEGSDSDRTGIRGLVIAEDVTMIAVPDLVTAATREDGQIDLDMWKAVQTALITHCDLAGNRMAILDPPPGMRPQQVGEWRADEAMYDSKFAALYYPWLRVDNPLAGHESNGDRSLLVPPSGHLAGIWARNDATRGVHKAPANEVVRGALNVATPITRGEQDLLNPMGVNCIRAFGTRGIRVWGARTLSSDPSWRYVNVRRLFNYVEESILGGTQWVVFEPNDLDLWQRVKRTVTAFLLGLWRSGALAGATPAQAFYVKCDAETNPQESVDEGKLVVEVGLSPTKPAEFVIFRISQWTGGAGAAE